VDTNCESGCCGLDHSRNDDALRAIRLFTSKISESVIEGRNHYQQSQVGEAKAAADQALADGVEYVDTSAYEQYEKQEGDFLEGTVVEPLPDAVVEPAEAAEPAAATVPPDGGVPLIQRG